MPALSPALRLSQAALTVWYPNAEAVHGLPRRMLSSCEQHMLKQKRLNG